MELKLKKEETKMIRELFENGRAYKEACAEMARRSFNADQEAWKIIKKLFPDIDFEKHRYGFNPHTGIIFQLEEKDELIIKTP